MPNDLNIAIIILEQVISALENDMRKKYKGDPNDISGLTVRLDRIVSILKKLKKL